MKIYIVIIEDRHTDPIACPFTDPDKAIAEARRIAKDYCEHEEDYEEFNYGRDEGWLFYAEYSCEGDSVHVVTTELDKEIT